MLEPLGYTSRILWHFISSSADNDALAILLEKIFNSSDNIFTLKKNPSAGDPYYRRNYSSEETMLQDLPKEDTSKIFFEPRAICFADIPFQHLNHHMNRYKDAIGLGFERQSLQEKLKHRIQPVRYIHDVSEKMWGKISSKQNDQTILNDYYKLHSYKSDPPEDFDSIYLEREWRSLDDQFTFKAEDLAFLVLRNQNDFQTINQKNSLIGGLNQSGVSIVNVEKIFPRKAKINEII